MEQVKECREGDDLFFVFLCEEHDLKISPFNLFVRNISYVVRIYVVFNTQVYLFVNITFDASLIKITEWEKLRRKLLINTFKDFTLVL